MFKYYVITQLVIFYW